MKGKHYHVYVNDGAGKILEPYKPFISFNKAGSQVSEDFGAPLEDQVTKFRFRDETFVEYEPETVRISGCEGECATDDFYNKRMKFEKRTGSRRSIYV